MNQSFFPNNRYNRHNSYWTYRGAARKIIIFLSTEIGLFLDIFFALKIFQATTVILCEFLRK